MSPETRSAQLPSPSLTRGRENSPHGGRTGISIRNHPPRAALRDFQRARTGEAGVKNKSRKVPVNTDDRKLPRDVLMLLRAKNAALHRASAYLTVFNRSRARAIQRKMWARKQEFGKGNWSTLMEEITPSHKAYWKLAKVLKSEGYEPTPALKKLDDAVVFDDPGKAECLVDSIEQQCFLTFPIRTPDREGSSTKNLS
ncbi:hypothetical protein EVAR_3870_1 [Eumeta japonica]|uniref:Uncharacterized protein n=1 Tax=Eumeta variegata TaxID=151549 RepID=A0A4C1STW5_EUMVA|nr:hypothetical protein EVAR_3870_1 [Eumeta japonica]